VKFRVLAIAGAFALLAIGLAYAFLPSSGHGRPVAGPSEGPPFFDLQMGSEWSVVGATFPVSAKLYIDPQSGDGSTAWIAVRRVRASTPVNVPRTANSENQVVYRQHVPLHLMWPPANHRWRWWGLLHPRDWKGGCLKGFAYQVEVDSGRKSGFGSTGFSTPWFACDPNAK
jgi:hypothetical protein